MKGGALNFLRKGGGGKDIPESVDNPKIIGMTMDEDKIIYLVEFKGNKYKIGWSEFCKHASRFYSLFV